MKTTQPFPTIRVVLLTLCAFVPVVAVPCAQAADSIDLTAYLKANPAKGATYQYFALGLFNDAYTGINAVTPLTTPFLPGYNAANFSEGGSTTKSSVTFDSGTTKFKFDNTEAVNTGPITFASGKLTNGATNGYVSGWAGVLALTSGSGTVSSGTITGTFHILFDLGASYNLTGVNISWQDSSGHRWGAGTEQKVFTATSLNQGVEGFSLLDSKTLNDGASTQNLSDTTVFDAAGDGIVARYVLLEITASVSTRGTGTQGGNLSEVTIMASSATPVPEPHAAALFLGGLGALAVAFRAAHRRR
ncbi:PEP-CTERM motif protein [Opitutaceae bacterium TAV1]|nr:PEP-CTERM motif protein [Opitutaceae bacterium TAV1]